jgi:hypothetical protein
MFIQAIKRHIKARTPRALEREMLLNNLRNNTFYQYEIIFDGKLWYAWFLKEQNVIDAMKEEVSE